MGMEGKFFIYLILCFLNLVSTLPFVVFLLGVINRFVRGFGLEIGICVIIGDEDEGEDDDEDEDEDGMHACFVTYRGLEWMEMEMKMEMEISWQHGSVFLGINYVSRRWGFSEV